MVQSPRSNAENVRLTQNTLAARDPNRVVVVVGSAAVVAQMYEAGIEVPIVSGDVDGLCPRPCVDSLRDFGPQFPGVSRFQVRESRVMLTDRAPQTMVDRVKGNTAVDMYPVDTENQLPLTVCHSMSALWYPIDYESALPDVVEAADIRCLRLAKVLAWTAAVGRKRDVELVGTVLSLARRAELISPVENIHIMQRLARARGLRAQSPDTYYAWADNGYFGSVQ